MFSLLTTFCGKLDCGGECFLSWPLFPETALKVMLGSVMWAFCPWYWSFLERLPKCCLRWQAEGRIKDHKRVWHLPGTPDRVAYADYAAGTSSSTCSVVNMPDLCNVCPGNCQLVQNLERRGVLCHSSMKLSNQLFWMDQIASTAVSTVVLHPLKCLTDGHDGLFCRELGNFQIY